VRQPLEGDLAPSAGIQRTSQGDERPDEAARGVALEAKAVTAVGG
jgi:hypothetical protein